MTAPRLGPRTYRATPSLWWWTAKRSYMLFILRELSSVFVAWLVLVLLLFAWSVAEGEDRYERFTEIFSHPVLVAVNVVALAFLLLHTVTWFNLTPKAMPLRLPGGRRVPPVLVVVSQWVGFALVSAVLVWLVVRQ
jgi:fumarate reductase subunit C